MLVNNLYWRGHYGITSLQESTCYYTISTGRTCSYNISTVRTSWYKIFKGGHDGFTIFTGEDMLAYYLYRGEHVMYPLYRDEMW